MADEKPTYPFMVGDIMELIAKFSYPPALSVKERSMEAQYSTRKTQFWAVHHITVSEHYTHMLDLFGSLLAKTHRRVCRQYSLNEEEGQELFRHVSMALEAGPLPTAREIWRARSIKAIFEKHQNNNCPVCNAPNRESLIAEGAEGDMWDMLPSPADDITDSFGFVGFFENN